MRRSELPAAIRARRVECGYAACGFALGLGYCLSSLLLDMQVRAWRSVDGSFSATFTSSLMHGLACLAPMVLACIAWFLGKRERAFRDRLMQLCATEVHLRSQAHTDALTGLFNRAHLARHLEEGIATREWAQRGALLYMLDLDGFKHVNDTHGHRAGDVVLTEIARRLAKAAGPDDIAVRLGGDEFILVHFPEMGEGAPDGFAEKLIAEVGCEIEIDRATRILPGTSIGIARVSDHGSTWSEVMRAADIALYEAKTEERSSYRLFEPRMREERNRRSLLQEDMRRGIEAGEFGLHYQPIHGAASGALRSFEALARWNHPERGLVSPLDFITLAESTNQIVPLGRQLLFEACRTAATWPKPIGVAVNLSPLQFKDPDLARNVAEALRSSGLAPGRLDLEVTESLLLENSPCVRATMAALRALGVRLTLDDFGTGFSSLSNLRAFRFDRLKIDRSFTREIASDGEEAEIIRTIGRLARTLRMETVLEGVETDLQTTFARGEGLTEVQGYLYARSMTRDDADAYIERQVLPKAAASAA